MNFHDKGGGEVSQKVIFHDERGGGVSQKVILHDEGGGGVQTPSKNMKSFMNSPLCVVCRSMQCSVVCSVQYCAARSSVQCALLCII